METTTLATYIKKPDGFEDGDSEEKSTASRWDAFRTQAWSRGWSRLPFVEREAGGTTSRKLLPTAWMDGLRGVACLVVFNFHYFFAFDQIAMVGIGATEKATSWIGLPGIRLTYEGVTAVSIFFCISGYVCSAKALKLMAQNNTDQALRGLVTSIFRRYLRLYLPVLFCLVCQVILAQMGAYDIIRPRFEDRAQHLPGRFSEPQLHHAPTIYQQMVFMLQEFWALSNIWRPGQYYAKHDPHYWTIPKEFASGLFLFLVLVGLSACRASARLAGLLMFAVVANWYDKFDTMLFLCGAAMAQYEILTKEKARESNESQRSGRSTRASAFKLVRIIGYVIAIYLMSFPRMANRTPAPNDKWVLRLVPFWVIWKEMFVKSLGSMLLIFLMLTSERQMASSNPSLPHRICNSHIALYMGRIMYPFYLIHGTVLHIFGYGIPFGVWAVIGQQNRLTWLVGYCIGWIISFAVSVWLADLFSRYIEPRCARITARVQELCS